MTEDKESKIVDYTIDCEGKKGDSDYLVLKNSCALKYDTVFNDDS